jgi:predicted RNA-binding protein with PUA-like domain
MDLTMGYWLLKTEPSTYGFSDLQRDAQTVWDGVRNAQALIHIRAMHAGDRALIYHSGDERAVVGTAWIASDPYPDPKAGDPKLVVVDVRASQPSTSPVPLPAIKTDPVFADMALVRQPRLSVLPVTSEQWQRLLELAGIREE